MRTLLIGLSTRALGESATLGGESVFSLDYFGDNDQKTLVENYSLNRDYRLPYSVENLVRTSTDLEFDAVVYTSTFENHPKAVAMLSERANILGNSPEVLTQVRDWFVLREFCHENSISHPQTLLAGEEKLASPKINWLCKPAHGGGGSGIRPWNHGPIKKDEILQACLNGLPASAAFVADGKSGVVIGLTLQLIGSDKLGRGGYSWCGNILPLPIDDDQRLNLLEALERIVSHLVRCFGLKGIGGIDFIAIKRADGSLKPFLIEINPRYTASMELVEWAYRLNIYSLHIEAFNGCLPQFCLNEHMNSPYFGKGIVFAYQPIIIGNTEEWAARGWKDIPYPGEMVKAGHPVCTVLAKGNTYNECLEKLYRNATIVRHETNDMGRHFNGQPIYVNHRAHHRSSQGAA
jgi:predicted ATP-grasp superfamily ATP-dependent carboligase